MRAASFLALEALACAANADALRTVQFDIGKRHPSEIVGDRMKEAAANEKRATINAPIGNALELYYINVSVGTPGQNLQLQLDTGSSDVWMIESGLSECRQQGACLGGTFNPSKSSTYKVSIPGGFNITYDDGSGSTGDYITDNINIAGQTITNQTMGLANQTTTNTGLVGVGFDNNEAICKTDACPNKYPSLIDQMASQGKIGTRAYSLWLNDLTASTGNILFGGVDTSKYTGELYGLPLLRSDGRQNVSAFEVAWTNLTLSTKDGVQSNIVPDDFLSPALLDSGTTTGTFPNSIARQLINQFGAQYSRTFQQYVAPCYLRTANATLDFTFGGSGGPVIHVPVSEFLLDTGTSQPVYFQNGKQACVLGFMPADGDDIILGDTFLRSAYVVYDLDNLVVGLAQTNFNGGSSNIKEISSGMYGIPGVSTTASAGTATSGSAGRPGNFYSPTASANAADFTSSINLNGAPPLASYTTASYTGQGSSPTSAANAIQGGSSGGGSGGSGSTNSKSASGHYHVPALKNEGLVVVGLMTIFAVFGSGAFML